MFNKINIRRVKTYLKNQEIEGIDKCKNEKEFLEKTKQHYVLMLESKEINSPKYYFKDKLVLLENEKIKMNDFNIIAIIGLIITIIFALITNSLGVVDKISLIENSYVSENSIVNTQIEKYEDSIEMAKFKLGIYDENEYYDNIIKINSDRKQKIIDNFKKHGEDAQEKMKGNLQLYKISFYLFIFLICIIFMIYIIIRPIYIMNKNIAINIHKRAIEENLNIIEKKEYEILKLKEKEQYFNELKKFLIESKSDSEIVLKACDKIINKMF
ncbi:hypothetical protein FDG50_00400 [Clostridium botulinum]|uniref:hypothetical protein n=1 Tax=Clostridium botulinum TaxID=1491 RepID=UPI0013FF687C|nr:hypothetical protein [Clostridium botulinum]MBY6835988.1 hypothetical protein [Clostridium botulinum]MBY6929793.1 hypothetical protein [Clostridium botulinum]NFG65772.1 hypothetical protein [Clostridium botulinum]NFQ22608.1 hypothetical protein [Clostridium botulinum]